MFLGNGQKRDARRIAANVWNEINSVNLSRTPEERLRVAKVMVRERIKDRRAVRPHKVGFAWEAIIVSLMTRLAFKLLERWLEKRLFSVSEDGDD